MPIPLAVIASLAGSSFLAGLATFNSIADLPIISSVMIDANIVIAFNSIADLHYSAKVKSMSKDKDTFNSIADLL